MSSFLRRAMVVTRARSAERRSTGGRVSARTTAAASNGSASIRSHASASRTSGRAKNDASPATRNGTFRSSSAAATSRPWRQPEPTTTQIRSGSVSPAERRASISRAAAWAWARSPSQRQKRTAPPPLGGDSACSPRSAWTAVPTTGPNRCWPGSSTSSAAG